MIFEGIKDKRVIVTGASSDIGYAISRAFMLNGAKIVAHSHSNICPILKLCEEARAINKNVTDVFPDANDSVYEPINIPCDLTNPGERIIFMSKAVEALDGIDILVNNAGDIFGGTTSFIGLSYYEWQRTIELDLAAPFFLSRDAFDYMRKEDKKERGGKIINISSIAAKYGGSETTMHYGAAKAGLEAITRSMARAGAQYNILVNAIQLGVVDTKLQKKLGRDISERVKSIPLKRAARPEEVAELCLFIASDAGNYITGQIYGLTGGD